EDDHVQRASTVAGRILVRGRQSRIEHCPAAPLLGVEEVCRLGLRLGIGVTEVLEQRGRLEVEGQYFKAIFLPKLLDERGDRSAGDVELPVLVHAAGDVKD